MNSSQARPRPRSIRSSGSTWISVTLAVIALANSTAAQSPVAEPEIRYREMRREIDRPVDQGFVDRSPIGTSLRRLPSDLSIGRSFDRLYQDSIDPQRFRRIQGGLSVVFPRSVYTADDQGTIAVVPPGSVFRIGDRAGAELPAVSSPAPRQRIGSLEGVELPGMSPSRGGRGPGPIGRARSNRLDARPLVATPIDGRVVQGGESEGEPRIGFGDPAEVFVAAPDLELPAILVDARYRRSRVEQLLLEAVAATP
ncbi:MAG: hypothetical protein ACO396_04850 [Phycisphaerales bacterium]